MQVAPRQVEIGAHLVGTRAGRKEEKNPNRHPRGPRVSSQGSAYDAKRPRIVKRSRGATKQIEADAHQKKKVGRPPATMPPSFKSPVSCSWLWLVLAKDRRSLLDFHQAVLGCLWTHPRWPKNLTLRALKSRRTILTATPCNSHASWWHFQTALRILL